MFVVIFQLNFWPGQNGRSHAHDILVTVSFVNTRLDNGLSPKRWQAIFQTNVDLQKIAPLETKRHSWFEPKTPKILWKEYFWK